MIAGEILQTIYENWGGDGWFTHGELLEKLPYWHTQDEISRRKNTLKNWLYYYTRKGLLRRRVGLERRRTKRNSWRWTVVSRFCLTKKALGVVKKYGSFVAENNPYHHGVRIRLS